MQGWEIALVCIFALIGLLVVGQLVAITAVLLGLKDLMVDLRNRTAPVIEKVDEVAGIARDVARTVGVHAGPVTEKIATTADGVSSRVARTSRLAHRIADAPLIILGALVQGIAAGTAVFAARRAERAATSRDSASPDVE